MVNLSLFELLVFILVFLVCLKFIFYCVATRSVRYNDWARDQKRVDLLETVRSVREEKGDYKNVSRSGIPKSRTPARRPARRTLHKQRRRRGF